MEPLAGMSHSGMTVPASAWPPWKAAAALLNASCICWLAGSWAMDLHTWQAGSGSCEHTYCLTRASAVQEGTSSTCGPVWRAGVACVARKHDPWRADGPGEMARVRWPG